jgi:autotransporter-associated beta strand protein
MASIVGTGSGALTKSEAGTWTLSGASTYTGTNTVSAGSLVAGRVGNAFGATTAAMAVMRRKIWPPTRVAPVCTPQHTNSLFLLIQAQLTVQQMELRQYKISPRIPTALPALILCRIRIINFS